LIYSHKSKILVLPQRLEQVFDLRMKKEDSYVQNFKDLQFKTKVRMSEIPHFLQNL